MTKENLFTNKLTLQAVVILLLAACFYLYEFIMQVAPGAISQNLMHDFAIDATELGLVSGCFYYSYTALQLPAGLLLDRYSSRVILTGVVFSCAIGVLLFAYAPNAFVAAVARLIMGAASACAFIGVLHLAVRWVPPAYFALFAGIVEMMGSIGGASGSKPFALLLKYFDWRTTISGFAYAGFILALLIALIIRNQPKELKSVAPSFQQTNRKFIWHNLKTVLHSFESWMIGFYSFFIWAPILGFAALWGTSFLSLNYNLDHIPATQAIAYIWLGIAVASPCIGWLSDLIGKRCIIMSICATVGTIAMTIIIFATNLSSLTLNFLMFLLGFASSGQTISFALIRDNNSPATNSTANGFNNMCVVAGGMLFQPLIGKILDLLWQGHTQNGVQIYTIGSYQLAFSLLAICYLLAAITSVFFIKETNCFSIWQKTEIK